jgi:fluoroquinolone transport system permease protein
MTLVRFEARKLISDRVYILFLLLPVILAAFFAVVWPVAESLTASRLDFDLTPYRSWLGVVIVYLAPQLLGMALGFRLLEEKDQGTLGYFSVMPIGLVGYLLSLLGMIGAVSFGYHLLLSFALPAHFSEWSYVTHVAIGLLTLLEGGIFALFLSMLARDKVEGMTMGKALSLLTAIPILVLVFPAWFASVGPAWLLGVTPWVWPALLLTVELPAGALPTPLLLYVIALLVHVAWIVLLFRSELRAVRQGRR